MTTSAPLDLGYRFARTLTLSNDEIIAGARFFDDQNPIHNDLTLAATSRFGGLIACGPHVSGIHACMLPTHCTNLGYDVLGTVFTVRYTAPVHADTLHELAWTITAITPHRSGGNLIDWTGTVTNQTTERVCIEATGQILVSQKP
jgi:3-hydroxybutyryl-CoA dehydratase